MEGVVPRRVMLAFGGAFGGVSKRAGCICIWDEGDEEVVSRPEGLYNQGDEERRCIPPKLKPAANASNVVYSYIAMRRGGVTN